MAYYAEIKKDIVQQVIVVNDELADGAKFCHELLAGVWVETFIDDPNKTYAGIGYSYNPLTKDFTDLQTNEVTK